MPTLESKAPFLARKVPAKPSLNPALKTFWRARARNRILYGGRASSKSWDAAGFAVWMAANYTIRFMCVRQFQNRIDESVYTLLKLQIERFGYASEFRILKNKIIHRYTGSEFIFYGLWRHITQIKSTEDVDVCWIEEGHDLTEEQWRILEPTIRKGGSQFWIIFNPNLASDFVYKRFVMNPPPNTIVRKINFDENPFLSQTMLDVITAMRDEDDDEYRHVYLGEPRSDDENVVIKRKWLIAALNAHRTLKMEIVGSKRLGFDIADGGADKCALVLAHGSLATWSDQWKADPDELLKSTTRAWDKAVEEKARVIYDNIGVGAMAGAKIIELNTANRNVVDVEFTGFNAGGKIIRPEAIYERSRRKNKDMFSNLKAQSWWSVADRLRNTYNFVRNGIPSRYEDMIFIDPKIPNIEKLLDELSTPKRDFNDAGQVKVESKKDLANPRRDGGAVASPNLADAFVMAFAPGYGVMLLNPDTVRKLRHGAKR